MKIKYKAIIAVLSVLLTFTSPTIAFDGELPAGHPVCVHKGAMTFSIYLATQQDVESLAKLFETGYCVITEVPIRYEAMGVEDGVLIMRILFEGRHKLIYTQASRALGRKF